MTARPGRVVVLDRDGTLVIDRGYLDDPAGLELVSGAREALQLLHAHACRLVIITNQSGVGRGFFPLERVLAMNARLETLVAEAGAHLEGIYFCPHAPDAGCECRKPALGLLARAAAELAFDPAAAVVVGDRESDIEFGRRAGAATVLIAADPGAQDPDAALPAPATRADFVVRDLLEAARAIVAGALAQPAKAVR